MMWIALFLNWVLHGQSFHYVPVYNFTNMDAMSHRFDFFASGSSVNIWEPVICWIITLLSAVTWVVLQRFPIHTAISDSQSLNPSMQEVMSSSKNERIFIQDWSYLTLQLVFDALWASMDVYSKRLIAWNYSRHVPSWQYYVHCQNEQTSSRGIICIDCHPVLRHPSEHGTSSMGKHLLTKAHIAKLNELTGSEVIKLTSSTVDETALAILKRQRSRGITIIHCSGNVSLISRLIHIDRNNRQNVRNRQLRTLKLLNFTGTRGIPTSCYDLFRLIIHGTLYRI